MRRFSHKQIVIGTIAGVYLALAGSGIIFAIAKLITDPNFRV
jgi:hypothetical protein